MAEPEKPMQTIARAVLKTHAIGQPWRRNCRPMPSLHLLRPPATPLGDAAPLPPPWPPPFFSVDALDRKWRASCSSFFEGERFGDDCELGLGFATWAFSGAGTDVSTEEKSPRFPASAATTALENWPGL
jgi:hypothetical protein